MLFARTFRVSRLGLTATLAVVCWAWGVVMCRSPGPSPALPLSPYRPTSVPTSTANIRF